MNVNILKQCIEWGKDHLISHGFLLQAEPFTIRDMPWSSVKCFDTNQGRVFLKWMSKPFAIESTLLHFLRNSIAASVPDMIGENNILSCFLMADAGEPLRNKLKQSYDIKLLRQALNAYTTIQIKCIPQVQALIKLNIPDWRLEKIPQLHQEFMKQEELLLSEGLNENEIKALQDSSSIQSLCLKLAKFGIPETIEHGDFQDNNMLIKNDTLSISDWGDSTITHPFFSLASVLHSAKRNHHFQENDPIYLIARETYLKSWQDYGNMADLLACFKIAEKIYPFVFSLSFSRIKACPHIDQYPQYNGYIAEALRELL